MSPARKMALLSSLYISQGLPFGFFTQALPVLMRKENISLGLIGLTQLLTLPWALKFLWAPLVDRWGSRRAWILPLQALSIAAVLLASALDPVAGFGPVLVLVLIVNLLAASQDIASDALAVGLLEERERGLGNGIQVAGFRVGMILGGGVLIVLYERIGWNTAMQALAVGLMVATLPVLFHREAARSAVPAFRLADAWSWVARPGAGTWLVVLLVYKTGDALATGVLRPFLVDAGFEMEQIGEVLGYVGFAAGLAGALAGGALVARLGRRRSLALFGLAQALSVAGYAWLAQRPTMAMSDLYAVAALEHLTGGMATVALFTVMMDACRPERAGTDYTLQACAVVAATGLAASGGGFLAQALGYTRFFILSALLAAAGTVLAMLLWKPSLEGKGPP